MRTQAEPLPLARTLLGFAVATAVFALFAPGRLAAPLAALAGMGLLAAYVAWRVALALERSGATAAAELPVHEAEQSTLLQAALRITQACAAAATPGEAREALAAVFRCELGAESITFPAGQATPAPVVAGPALAIAADELATLCEIARIQLDNVERRTPVSQDVATQREFVPRLGPPRPDTDRPIGVASR